MTPGRPIKNTIDAGGANAIQRRYPTSRSAAGGQHSYFSHLFSCNAVLAVRLAAQHCFRMGVSSIAQARRHSPFANGVLHVLAICPKEQVFWIAAGSIVAGVTNTHSFCRRPHSNAICQNVRAKKMSVIVDSAISAFVQRPGPGPTAAHAPAFVDAFPKAALRFFYDDADNALPATKAVVPARHMGRLGMKLFPTDDTLYDHFALQIRRPLGSAVLAEDTREPRGHNRKRRLSCTCPQHRQYSTTRLASQAVAEAPDVASECVRWAIIEWSGEAR